MVGTTVPMWHPRNLDHQPNIYVALSHRMPNNGESNKMGSFN
jgi:hypothetical protein